MEKDKINIRKKEYEIKKKIILGGDVLIPDIKPDIINIVGNNGSCLIRKEEISNEKIRLDGIWNGNVIYLSDIGEIKSLKTNFEFWENFENTKIVSKDEIEYEYKLISIETKILNERKVNISIELEYTITGFKLDEIEVVSNFDTEKNIEKLEEKILTRKFVTTNVTKTSINEDVNFSELGKKIEILKQDVRIVNIEKKVSYNKVLAKAEADISLLYLCDNQVKKFNTKIPVMSFIDIENVKEENIIDINYRTRRFNIIDNVLEKNTINCDMEFEISCSIYEKKEMTIIKDLYSLEDDVKYLKKDVNMEIYEDKINDVYEFNERINIDGLKEIYDYEYSLKKMESNDGKNYEGLVSLNIYYSKEENNSFMIKTLDIPFIIKNSKSEYKYCLNNLELKTSNNEVVCNFKLEVLENIKYKKVELLNDCEIVEGKKENEYSMVIYFVKPNDSVWDIAKKFKVSSESIINLNNLEDGNIFSGEKLYIMKG